MRLGLETRFHLCHGRRCRQASDEVEHRRRALTKVEGLHARERIAMHRRRNPNVHCLTDIDATKVLRCNTDDRERSSIDRNRSTQYRLSSEATLPERMTDDDDGTLALSPPFVFREDPSDQGPNAEHAKVVVGDESRGHLLRFPGVVGEGDENCDVRCNVEAKRLLQVFIILERRCARFLGRTALAEYRVERLRIAHGSGRQKQGVEETEYGGVCADSQREHEHDRGRIKRRASEAADRLSDVAGEAVERGKAPSIPARLVSAPQASESSTSLGHRGDGAKTFSLEIASQ